MARLLGMPANLMHHHVQRLTELGLLYQTERKNGKVYYQLTASSYRYPLDLVPSEESQRDVLGELARDFMKAYSRSEHFAGDLSHETAVFNFSKEHVFPECTMEPTQEARPAHLQIRRVRLSASQYREAVEKIYQILFDLQENTQDDARTCTLGFVAFEKDQDRNGHLLDSYVMM